jgi:hypothetical protein
LKFFQKLFWNRFWKIIKKDKADDTESAFSH